MYELHLTGLEITGVWSVIAAAVISLLYAYWLRRKVLAEDKGTPVMQKVLMPGATELPALSLCRMCIHSAHCPREEPGPQFRHPPVRSGGRPAARMASFTASSSAARGLFAKITICM